MHSPSNTFQLCIVYRNNSRWVVDTHHAQRCEVSNTEHLHLYHVQEEQRVVLDQQVQEKQRVKVQQQQAKVQDAQDLAAALKQHKLEEAKSAAARKTAALKSKALMANQVCTVACGVCIGRILHKSPG